MDEKWIYGNSYKVELDPHSFTEINWAHEKKKNCQKVNVGVDGKCMVVTWHRVTSSPIATNAHAWHSNGHFLHISVEYWQNFDRIMLKQICFHHKKK